MLDALAGLGLASSAGLNAYIPSITVALAARFGDEQLPHELRWLGNGWVLGILVALLIVEVVVDKVPGADHVNDVAQTVIRPAAGAVVFAAQTTDSFGGRLWPGLIVGLVSALTVHGTKAAARGASNTVTFGLAAPVLSVVEDVVAAITSILAIIAPILVLVMLALFAWLAWRVIRWRRQRRHRPRGGTMASTR